MLFLFMFMLLNIMFLGPFVERDSILVTPEIPSFSF